MKTCESTTYRTFSKIHACGLPVVLSWEVNHNNGLISDAPKCTKHIPPKRTKPKKNPKTHHANAKFSRPPGIKPGTTPVTSWTSVPR
ncbi:hypothetical protein ARMGADRAFT_297060 [Armillaria gallica]|uniref:Uncharacterized protein n=1 Tax=Armillaria gallica TaxID=47427 RepID=A0A2H3DMT2_ARMGA|nr:hypothetical protein ARMGADRAFT_297060 [Armillaria gallica]